MYICGAEDLVLFDHLAYSVYLSNNWHASSGGCSCMSVKGNRPRLAQSTFWLICLQILIRNKRKLASAGAYFGWFAIKFSLEMKGNWRRLAQRTLWLTCYQILIRNERKLASAGSEQVLMNLLLNSNCEWKEIGVGWLRAGVGWFAIKFSLQTKGNWPRLAKSLFWFICY